MRHCTLALIAVGSLVASGSVTETAAAVVATTSHHETDEKHSRERRKQEEELAKLERRYEKQLKRCREGDRRICERAKLTYADIQKLLRDMPAEPDD